MKHSLVATAALVAWAAIPRPATAQTLTLAAAVDSALAYHPAVHSARARERGAREAEAAARGERLPGVAASAALTRFQQPMIVAPLHGFDLTTPPTFDRMLVQARVGAQHLLFDGGARDARIRGAGLRARAADHTREGAEAALLERVAEGYLRVQSARAVEEASTTYLGALTEERERAGRHLAAGTAAEIDALRAEAALQDARAQLAGARARRELAEQSLARLTGIGLERVRAFMLPELRGTPAARAEDETAPADVRAAERFAEAADADLRRERAARLPRVEATAGLLDFGTATGDHVLEWQAGVQVTWPLFTGGARGAAVRRAEAERDAARGALALSRLERDAAVDAALAARTEAAARAEALATSVEQWQEVARIEALSLDAGAGEQRDLLRAEASLLQARAGLATARNEEVLAAVRLAHALGRLERSWFDRALEMDR